MVGPAVHRTRPLDSQPGEIICDRSIHHGRRMLPFLGPYPPPVYGPAVGPSSELGLSAAISSVVGV